MNTHLRRRLRMLPLCCLCVMSLSAQNSDTIKTPSSTKQSSQKLQRGHMNNALDALSGTNAGVTIGNDANSEAMLSSVRIRGNSSLTGGNEPLVIIDGMSSDLRTLASIYPADIESLRVLKEASETAQYGSRGASGVIVVDTKRGHTGASFYAGYSGDMGFAHAEKFLPMLSANEYRSLNNRLGLSIYDGGADTDWQRSIVRTGFVQNHHIACGGGTDATQYRASLSLAHNNSIIKTINNYNLTTKLDVTQKALNNRLTIDLGLFGSTQQNKYINNEQKLYYSAAAFNPTIANKQNANGSWIGYADASQVNNPMGLLDILIHQNAMHFNTHARLQYDILSNLSASVYASYSYANQEDNKFYPTYMESTGKIYRGHEKETRWLMNADLNYTNTWGQGRDSHKLDARLLLEMQGLRNDGFHTTVNMLASNRYYYYNLAIGAMRLWDGTGSIYQKQNMLSIMGNVSYLALDRYKLSATLRTDASSLINAAHRWGLFPSFSFSWDMKKEPWLDEIDAISQLKLNTSFGITGNLGGISAYNSLMLYSPVGIVDNEGLPAVSITALRNSNQDLKWEKKYTYDLGAQLGLFSDRLLLQIDAYYSLITDMIYNYTVSVPPFTYNTLLANLGRMENHGIEAGVGIVAVQNKDFDFNINLNLTWQQNKLLSLSGYLGDQYLFAPQYTALASLNGAGLHGGYSNVTYQIVGQPLGVFYLPHCKGLKQQADGTMEYVIDDTNQDGLIDISNGADRRICGQATPKILLGSNFSFRYKQFDITLQMNGAFGHKIYNGSALSYNNLGSLPFYNVSKKAEQLNINDLTVTDYWLENGDYLNIDYITIGWTLPNRQGSKLQQLRLSFSVNNLATITGYSGLSPMINSSVINSTLGIDDKSTIPVYRTYSFAFNIQF